MKPIRRLFVLGFFVLVSAGLAVFAGVNSDRDAEGARANVAGACLPVSGIPGAADLQIDPETRLAFVSSYDRRSDGAARGGVYALSIDDPLAEDAWRDRTGGIPAAFEPRGIYLYRDESVRRLFVVNAARRSVELYDVEEDGDLAHLETFRERRMTGPNDVAAVGPRAFYVSNDPSVGRDSLVARIRYMTRAASGNLLHFDGMAWKLAAEDLRFAAGVGVSNDGRRVYAAETSAGALKIFDRTPSTGQLNLRRTIAMPAAPENFNVDGDGSLWIGAQPKTALPPRYRRKGTDKAASVVIRYKDRPGGDARPEEVYVDNGEELSASSSAARFGSTMLIGASFEEKFLICRLDD